MYDETDVFTLNNCVNLYKIKNSVKNNENIVDKYT